MIQGNEIIVGIDLGGTNVRAGAVTQDGALLLWRDAPIEAARGPAVGLLTIKQLANEVLAKVDRPLLALGVGSTGPLHREHGFIQNPYTLPGWENVDIVRPLQSWFGVPVALENDADAAALGESWMGAGQNMPRMAMVTIGTGVGTAFILNGEIYRGLGGEHPEGGHMIVDPSGPQCYCGAHGCWESLVAGPAIARFARDADGLHSSMLFAECGRDPEGITAKMVFDSARQGDQFCLHLVEQVASDIGLGLINLMTMTLPDCIVLTGGIFRSYDLLEARIRSVIVQHNAVIPATKVHVQLAKLGQQAGMFGAARAAQSLLMDQEA